MEQIVEDSYSKNTKYFNKKIIEKQTEKLLKYYSDQDKKERKKEGLCKFCYYYNYDRIGGCAITIKKCENCGTEMSFGSTATDMYCLDCAINNGFCKQCGQKMD